jgi:hypothetical protein
MQNKFHPINNPNKESKIYDVKDEYAYQKDHNNAFNFEEIRKRVYYTKENSICLIKNENIKLHQYENSNQNIFAEKKPKTSSDAIKSNRLDLIAGGLSDGNNIENTEYTNNNLITESNSNGDMDKFLYNIVSKKLKNPGISSIKNYESTLPSFKISQRMNKLPKELNNYKNISPSNRLYLNINGNHLGNNVLSNMNYTTKNTRFLPNINNKQINLNKNGPSLYVNEKNHNNGFKLTKGMQFNLKLNK